LDDKKNMKQISLSLPIDWVETIDSQVNSFQTRQDIIRKCLDPYIVSIKRTLIKEE